MPYAQYGSAVNASKHEFLQQIFNQRIELSAKGFFAVNRRFLATVSFSLCHIEIGNFS